MTTPAPFFIIDYIGKGFLAVMAHPAREGDAAMMIRDLAAQGVRQVISLLDADEARELGLEHGAELVHQQSMDFVSFPIPDMGLPRSVEDFASLSNNLFHQVEVGINTLIHCRAGIGRSGLLASAVLLHGGRNVQQAFVRVSHMRGCRVPETPQQGDWLLENHPLITAMDDLMSKSKIE